MTIAIVNCGELLTLRGPARPRVGAELRELAIVRNGAVLIKAGRIAHAGRAKGLVVPRGARVIDAGGGYHGVVI